MIRNSPSEQVVSSFVDKIYEARALDYRDRFFYIDYEAKRESELGKMKWLREEDLITENEYLVVVDEINESLLD
jgi:hypothetical protein